MKGCSMMKKVKSDELLLRLLNNSQSPFHSLAEGKKILEENGFEAWDWTKSQKLSPGKAYYTAAYERSLIAFRTPSAALSGFRIAAAHIDTPCFMIKPKPERNKSGYITLNVEKYGGPILNTWLDRPLTIAGRVCIETEDPFKPQVRLYSSEVPVAVIPNLAIHMNREVNKGVELKVQNDMEPVAALASGDVLTEGYLLRQVGDQLGVSPEAILDYELFLCNGDAPAVTGFDRELLSAPRLDNLTSCASCLAGLLETDAQEGTCSIAVLFDNEECGSRSKQGAGSSMMATVLERIVYALGTGTAREDFLNVMLNSMIVSLDVAHATHPNHPEKNDPTNQIPIDGGVVFKMSYNQRYATDTVALAIGEGICRKNGIAHVKFVNQGDTAGGGTLGSILSATIPVMTMDIGIPLLAMHSARELMALKSQEAMDSFTSLFFRSGKLPEAQ